MTSRSNFTNKENQSPSTNSKYQKIGKKEAKEKKKVLKMNYLKALDRASVEVDLGAKEYKEVFEASFRDDSINMNCKKLRLLSILDVAVIEQYERVKDIFTTHKESFRYILKVYQNMNTRSSSESSKPLDLKDFKFYFNQWFMSMCRALLSVQLLLVGEAHFTEQNKSRPYFKLPDEEENYALNEYVTLRSVKQVDILFTDTMNYFEQVISLIIFFTDVSS